MHETIDGTKEEIRRSGAKARQVALEKSSVVGDVSSEEWWNGGSYPKQRGAVLWQLDRRDVDEVERFPLQGC